MGNTYSSTFERRFSFVIKELEVCGDEFGGWLMNLIEWISVEKRDSIVTPALANLQACIKIIRFILIVFKNLLQTFCRNVKPTAEKKRDRHDLF